jgi:hypothetical protein
MSAPTINDEDGDNDSTDAVSADEALDMLPNEEDFETEFDA